MFDCIHCGVPLPDGFAASGVEFQTKSLPDSSLWTYRITADGLLLDPWGRILVNRAKHR